MNLMTPAPAMLCGFVNETTGAHGNCTILRCVYNCAANSNALSSLAVDHDEAFASMGAA